MPCSGPTAFEGHGARFSWGAVGAAGAGLLADEMAHFRGLLRQAGSSRALDVFES